MATALSPDATQLLAADAKLGVLGTVDPEGLPHLTLITTLQGRSKKQLMWGQFCEGRSKAHVRQNPRVAFSVLSLDRRMLHGRAIWTGSVTEGPEYEHYNQKPLFRYNSYFGVHTVHYMDVVSCSPSARLSIPRLLSEKVRAASIRLLPSLRNGPRPLTPWAANLLNSPGTVAFVSYVDRAGFPHIVPGVACQARHRRQLILAGSGHLYIGSKLPAGTPIAIFAVDQQTRSVLVRGVLRRPRSLWIAGLAYVDVDWVYNTMPPVPGVVWPPQPLIPVSAA